MNAILTSVLAGGWGLVAGWMLPTVLNAVIFAVFVLPSLHTVAALHALATISNPWQAVAILAIGVVGGLLLNALATPLYRILEGYVLRGRVLEWRLGQQLKRKQTLKLQVEVAQLTRFERRQDLTGQETKRLAELRSDPAKQQIFQEFGKSAGWRVSQLQEQLRRYPVDDDQLLPTKLGNAIRRFEEYGYDRYRLDIIVFWYALTGVAPEQVRKQEGISRASADFFVCLLYGHLLVLAFGLAAIAVNPGHPVRPLIAVVATVLLIPLWYRLAVEATDDWAASVRALVDVGRKPLAEAMNMTIPVSTEEERRMWSAVSRFSRRPYQGAEPDITRYRSNGTGPRSAPKRRLGRAGRH